MSGSKYGKPSDTKGSTYSHITERILDLPKEANDIPPCMKGGKALDHTNVHTLKPFMTAECYSIIAHIIHYYHRVVFNQLLLYFKKKGDVKSLIWA